MIESRFGTSPAPTACGCLSDKSVSRKAHIARTRKYGPGGEGREHLRIKEWLREHPELIGMNDIVRATAEHVFPSGDCADLLFKRGDGGYSVVEIETMAPLSGAYRIIKHRALLCAEQGLELYGPTSMRSWSHGPFQVRLKPSADATGSLPGNCRSSPISIW